MDNIFNLNELEKIIKDALKEASLMVPDEYNDEELTVKYLTTSKLYKHAYLLDGLYEKFYFKHKNIKEQDKLRSNTKNYVIKYYSKDGKLRKIEITESCYQGMIYYVKYSENRRFIFPRRPEGLFCPEEAFITIYNNDGNVVDEYMIEGSCQIIANHYTYQNDRTVIHDSINYIPHSTNYPINSLYRSKLFLDDASKNIFIDSYSWLDDYRKTWK